VDIELQVDCQANAAEPRTQNDEEDTFNTEFTIQDALAQN